MRQCGYYRPRWSWENAANGDIREPKWTQWRCSWRRLLDHCRWYGRENHRIPGDVRRKKCEIKNVRIGKFWWMPSKKNWANSKEDGKFALTMSIMPSKLTWTLFWDHWRQWRRVMMFGYCSRWGQVTKNCGREWNLVKTWFWIQLPRKTQYEVVGKN